MLNLIKKKISINVNIWINFEWNTVEMVEGFIPQKLYWYIWSWLIMIKLLNVLFVSNANVVFIHIEIYQEKSWH